MIINELLKKENMSRYRLCKESGVAMTTITDICNGKAQLDKCAAGTLYKIARVFGVTVDFLLENNEEQSADYRCSFETFKSNTCHHVKDIGDIKKSIVKLALEKINNADKYSYDSGCLNEFGEKIIMPVGTFRKKSEYIIEIAKKLVNDYK